MVILLVGLFKGPYRKQYLALRAAEKQQKSTWHSGGMNNG